MLEVRVSSLCMYWCYPCATSPSSPSRTCDLPEEMLGDTSPYWSVCGLPWVISQKAVTVWGCCSEVSSDLYYLKGTHLGEVTCLWNVRGMWLVCQGMTESCDSVRFSQSQCKSSLQFWPWLSLILQPVDVANDVKSNAWEVIQKAVV